MLYAKVVFGIMTAATAALFAATHSNQLDKWIGVWNGDLEGQPGVILTLAEEDGELSGTVVFNVVIKENGIAHLAGSSIHVVKHPSIDGDLLDFHITRHRDFRELDMKIRWLKDGKAELQCRNCGAENPVTVLTRSN